jgi:hypothetical protein
MFMAFFECPARLQAVAIDLSQVARQFGINRSTPFHFQTGETRLGVPFKVTVQFLLHHEILSNEVRAL